MTLAGLGVPLDLEPMEARLAPTLPEGAGWQFEPKWDGFRCLAFRDGDEVALRAKSGKGLDRFFPEVVAGLRGALVERFVLDGELVIDAASPFSALQARLHPAPSRIARLSRETPARLVAFDALLTPEDGVLIGHALRVRRGALERLVPLLGDAAGVSLARATDDRGEAERWLAGAGGVTDGVVAKRLDAPYAPGERAMVKVKRVRTADCVVGGYRTLTRGPLVGSLLLGLYDRDGRLHHVGFSSAIADAERPALTARLAALRGESAFAGSAPGGASRWANARSAEWVPIRPELVVEVQFDQVTDGRFRHGVSIVRWRPDKAPHQCTCEQLRN